MTRIAIIIGSTRPGRRARAVGDWVAAIAERHLAAAGRDATVEVVDLADHALPLLDERTPAIFGAYEHPHTRRWGKDHDTTVAEMLDELLAWTDALRALRTPGVTTHVAA
jgi:NAD(P)H-dependent FMN reductase